MFPIFAVSGNLVLAAIFLSALLFPIENGRFILLAAPFFFPMEFLGMLAWLMGLAFGKEAALGARSRMGQIVARAILALMGLPFLFGFFVAAMLIGYHTRSLFLGLAFFVGIAARFYKSNWRAHPLKPFILMMVLWITLGLAGATVSFWSRAIPFPKEFFALPGKFGAGGVFAETPQAFLVWGISYYILAAFLEACFVFKDKYFPKTVEESIPAVPEEKFFLRPKKLGKFIFFSSKK